MYFVNVMYTFKFFFHCLELLLNWHICAYVTNMTHIHTYVAVFFKDYLGQLL